MKNALATLVLALVAVTASAAIPGRLAIVGATIIDGNGGAPIQNGVVLIEGKRIVGVGDASLSVPAHSKIISAPGKFVMPGLMDANVHLFYVPVPDALVRYEGRYEEVIAEAAQIALAQGLTTVFDTWGPREALINVRDAINAGTIIGSRIFLAGNIIGLGGPTSPDFFKISRTVLAKSQADAIDARWEQGVGPELLWMTPAQIRERIKAYIASGHVDFLKYAASGHQQEQFITFSPEGNRAIVEEGHRAGMIVQAHTTSPESLRLEIEAGADLLQHCDVTGPAPMPEATLQLITQRKLPCGALFMTRRNMAWREVHGIEPWKGYDKVQDDNDRRLVAASATLLLNSDGGVVPSNAAEHPIFKEFAVMDDSPTELGESSFRWLQAASELGMTPMQALMAATRNIARAYKVDANLGTVEKGKFADLLILDRNPLENAANYRTIRVVIKEGQLVDRAVLPNLKVLTLSQPPTPASGVRRYQVGQETPVLRD